MPSESATDPKTGITLRSHVRQLIEVGGQYVLVLPAPMAVLGHNQDLGGMRTLGCL